MGHEDLSVEDGSGFVASEGVTIITDVNAVDHAVLKDAIAKLDEAMRKVKPREDESEQVVVDPWLPDRRLSNGDQELDRFVLQSARKKFDIGPFSPRPE